MMMSRENLHKIVAKERAKRELIRAVQRGFEAFEHERRIKVIAEETGFPVELIRKAAEQGNYAGLEDLAVKAIETKTTELIKLFKDDYDDTGWLFQNYGVFNAKYYTEEIECPEYLLIKSSDFYSIFEIYEDTDLWVIEGILLNSTEYEREHFYLIKQGEIQHFEVKLDDNFKPYIIYLLNRDDEANEYKVLKRGIKKKVQKPKRTKAVVKLSDEEIDFMFN